MSAHDRSLWLYVAGPMRAIPQFNFPAFDVATETLRELGHSVFSPAERDREVGFDPSGMDGNEDLAEHGFDLRDALGADLRFICEHADAVIVLPGWKTSSGALAEVATARALGLPVHRLHEFVQWGLDAPSVQDGIHESDDWRNGRMVEVGGPDDRYLSDPLATSDDDTPDVGQPAAQPKVVGPAPKRTTGDVLGAVGPATKTQPTPDWRVHAAKVMAEDPERPLLERTDLAQSDFDARMAEQRRRAEAVRRLAESIRRHEARERAKQLHPSNPQPPVESEVESSVDGEVRVVSATGGAKGRKPAEMGAIDPLARTELAKVAGFGSRKYQRFNYLKGIDWSLSIDALHRHLAAFEAGEDRDYESGCLHMAHAAWHALALCSFVLRGIGTDDRFPADGPVVESEAA